MRWLFSLSEEYFAQYFVGTPLAWRRSPKLSMFRTSFLPVTSLSMDWANWLQKFKRLQLRLPLSDQLGTQAVAAREEEVSVLEKLGPLLREKIQFFVKGVGATRVRRGHPSEYLSSVLVLSQGVYVCHNGKSLDVESSIEALGLFLVAQFVSIRG